MVYPRNRELRALPQYSTCSDWLVLAPSVLTLQNILWANRQTVKLHEIKTKNQKTSVSENNEKRRTLSPVRSQMTF